MGAATTRRLKSRNGSHLLFTELGFGSASLGNLYQAISEKDARRTLD
ncbi:MAG: aldo/keto reductase, partial [Methylobacteriaceae bacterium]|nr:aldo/keto reductase [Methylobacteriaceae bacterium]